MSATDLVFPTAEELGPGVWALDKMHAPRPVTPLSFDLVAFPLAEAFTEAQAEYDAPRMVTVKEINHYMYVNFHLVPDEAVLADRAPRYEATLAEKVPKIGARWEEEWKPAVKAANEAAKTADFSGMTDRELVATVDEFAQRLRHQWWIHGNINFVLLSGAAFCDMYDEVVQPAEATEAYQTLQGFHTRSVDVSRGLWRLSRLIKQSTALRALLEDASGSAVIADLDRTADGRAFLQELDAFLDEFGWRSDAVYDLADVSWREDRAIPLAVIAGYVELDDRLDPEVLYQAAVKRREQLLAKARSALADEPVRLAKFDELYEAARYTVPVTEDHAFYIDQLGVGVFRRFAVTLGERLVEKGIVDDVTDVFFLRRAELEDLLLHGGDPRAAIADRRASFAAASHVVPPGPLGAPEPGFDPFFDAVVVRLLGITPPDENPDPDVLRGVAGSPGAFTGTARVVRSLAEASDLEEGEVMVCEMTLPPWVPLFSIAGAIVADVGGVLSHCAIVAREYALPAVVGSTTGTMVIKTGQTVTVDGTNGVVYLDGRAL